jgi:outer membrane protein assembly factor BamB
MFGLVERSYLAVAVASNVSRFARVLVMFLAIASGQLPSGAEARVLTNAWSFMISAPCDSSPAIGDDGTIYFGVWNGDFRAFSPDGSPKWVFRAGREIKSSPAIGRDGTLYFGSRDRKLYAVGAD